MDAEPRYVYAAGGRKWGFRVGSKRAGQEPLCCVYLVEKPVEGWYCYKINKEMYMVSPCYRYLWAWKLEGGPAKGWVSDYEG